MTWALLMEDNLVEEMDMLQTQHGLQAVAAGLPPSFVMGPGAKRLFLSLEVVVAAARVMVALVVDLKGGVLPTILEMVKEGPSLKEARAVIFR